MTGVEPGQDAPVEVDVGPVAHGGHCVARHDGQVIFVRHALPGERVRIQVTERRRGYLRADAIEVLTPSPQRVTPPCPYAGPDRCGGCDFQHAGLAAQRELKTAVVREQLARLGGLSQAQLDALAVQVRALPDVAGQPEGLGWRTRVQYTVDAQDRAGLLKHRSHEVVPIDRCRIAHPLVQAAEITQRDWPDADGVEVVASAAGEVTVLGRHGRRPPAVLSGPARIRERAIGRDWHLDADSFWQVHPAAAETFAATVVELLEPRPGERAWDLYGGAGLFAAALAPHLGEQGRISVVEADRRTAATARRMLADLPQVSVVHAPVERALRNPRWRSVDLVVLDPPRSGAGRGVVEAIVAREPRLVAYVACDPAALARDVRTFTALGWRVAGLRAYDAFPMTHHLETIALLAKGS